MSGGILGGLADSLFGGGSGVTTPPPVVQDPSQQVTDANGNVLASTTTTATGTKTSLDPQIATLQASGLAGTDAALTAYNNAQGTVTDNNNSLYNAAGTNKGAYVDSVTAPMKALASTNYGNMVNSDALRGMAGSSLANESLTNYTNDTNQAIGNATAGALQQSIGLQSGINQNQSGVNAGLNTAATTAAGTQLAEAGNIANQDLSTMQLGQTGASISAGIQSTNNSNNLAAQGLTVNAQGQATDALGRVIGAAGSVATASALKD